MKVYAKNSFDRFGDDLTEEILQYLTFEDKIRLECVSKQWKRCVYTKQFEIILKPYKVEYKNVKTGTDSRRQVNEQHLESVLKKCPNIKRVDLYLALNSSVLSLIGRYCHRIKSLAHVYSNEDKALDFFRINGHKLEELYLSKKDYYNDITEKDNEILKSLLKYCTNLKTIYFPNRSLPLFGDKEYLPKLKAINNLWICSKEVNEMKILSDKYSQTMKILNVMLLKMTAEELKTCIECIARFENLKELKIRLKSIVSQSIDDCLSLIGQKCTKLLKLQFNDYCWAAKSDQICIAIYKFTTIKVFRIYLPKNTVLSESVECFKHCKQLIELYISYDELTEDFFANIASFVPKLKTLRIRTEKQYSDSFINSFHSMKNLQKVEIALRYVLNFHSEYKTWYFGKSLLEVMLSPNGMNVKHINDNCGLITKNN